MITRIVKLSIQDNKTAQFESIFYKSKNLIEEFEGCISTNLYSDIKNQYQYFTISYWDSEEHLNSYRKSELFVNTWACVKPLFNHKAEAWSLTGHVKLF